jgi:hypothetical protein
MTPFVAGAPQETHGALLESLQASAPRRRAPCPLPWLIVLHWFLAVVTRTHRPLPQALCCADTVVVMALEIRRPPIEANFFARAAAVFAAEPVEARSYSQCTCFGIESRVPLRCRSFFSLSGLFSDIAVQQNRFPFPQRTPLPHQRVPPRLQVPFKEDNDVCLWFMRLL